MGGCGNMLFVSGFKEFLREGSFPNSLCPGAFMCSAAASLIYMQKADPGTAPSQLNLGKAWFVSRSLESGTGI